MQRLMTGHGDKDKVMPENSVPVSQPAPTWLAGVSSHELRVVRHYCIQVQPYVNDLGDSKSDVE
jgi:hypothetical protein